MSMDADGKATGDAAQTEMMRTEAGLGFQAGLTAALAVGEAVQAAERLVLSGDDRDFQCSAGACGVNGGHDFQNRRHPFGQARKRKKTQG